LCCVGLQEHLFLVCELLRANLYEFQKYQRENGDEPYFTMSRIQRIAIQVGLPTASAARHQLLYCCCTCCLFLQQLVPASAGYGTMVDVVMQPAEAVFVGCVDLVTVRQDAVLPV
jgi:hypothetical protein